MARQGILGEMQEMFGLVPGYLADLPEEQLEQIWPQFKWLLSDTTLTAQQKALVSFGVAAALPLPNPLPPSAVSAPWHGAAAHAGGSRDCAAHRRLRDISTGNPLSGRRVSA